MPPASRLPPPASFYVTTSIAYANAEPHVGYAMESIEADVLARYHRQRGVETRFLTGTDEHGVKIQRTAETAGITPAELTDQNSARFRALREPLNLSWDDFIRTTDRTRHFPAVTKIWQKLVAAGALEKHKYTGLYCAGCEEFKRETDLVDECCPNHQTPPQKVEEENWFFRLSDYSARILELLESRQVAIVPEFRAKEIINVVRDGLHDVSFSRPTKSLTWGIPVPDDATQTMYVWCDALTNYISAIGYGVDQRPTTDDSKTSDFGLQTSDFEKWWSKDTQKVHVIGKDIVRFHAGIWLGMLLAAGLELPNKIYVHGFITSEGQKMSKSLGNVVDPLTIVNEWGTDALRYYLLSEIPNGQDGDFSQKRFVEKYEAELANGLGNLVSRVVAMAIKTNNQQPTTNNINGGIHSAEVGENSQNDDDRNVFSITNLDPVGKSETETMWRGIEKAMSDFDFRSALSAIHALVTWANKYVDDMKPWALAKTEPEKNLAVLSTLLETIRHLTLALTPFIPESANKILAALGVELNGDFEKLKQWGAVSEFHLTRPEILFPKKA